MMLMTADRVLRKLCDGEGSNCRRSSGVMWASVSCSSLARVSPSSWMGARAAVLASVAAAYAAQGTEPQL